MNPPNPNPFAPGTAVSRRRRSLSPFSLALVAMLITVFIAQGATVIWRAPNVTVHLDLPFASLEFQNPLAGTETVLGHPVLEWLDADYTPGNPPGFGNWIVNDTNNIDGNVNEVWLRATGQLAQTKIHVPTDIVSVHLVGDNNDGIAVVEVDGNAVAKLNMFHASPPSQTALIIVRDLPVRMHDVVVRDESPDTPTDVAILGAAALTNDFKWRQPPELMDVANIYNGWKEPSVTNLPPIAADDWVCTSTNPVTKIRWWGSFANWVSNTPPPFLPNAFQITIWTDVPAVAGDPAGFSHPGVAIWQAHCTSFKPPKFVGWDYDPRTGQYEACFLFEQDLLPDEWFYQYPGPFGTNVYWISIAGEYWQGLESPWAWGWKTRPRDLTSPAPDDAVRMHVPPPWLIEPGTICEASDPIFWPDPEYSWDLAFELISSFESAGSKWEQWPDLSPMGMDVKDCLGPPPPPILLADDFQCTAPGPITNITIWGSWLRDFLPSDPGNVVFTLSLHLDIPANESPTGYSMPGPPVWLHTFQPGSFAVTVLARDLNEGWFTPPESFDPQGDTICYQYDFPIPVTEAFIQEGDPTHPMVYWLDCQAQVLPQPGAEEAQFGWKTCITNWHDTAVWVTGSEPYQDPIWNQLVVPPPSPAPGPRDLAFRINTGAQSVNEVKWSQPPASFPGTNNFNGWNETSVRGSTKIVADDWACADPRPLTDIHWWGSFVGWQLPSPPETAFSFPQAFTFTIWTDVPADLTGANPWGHPGKAFWQFTTTNVAFSFAGWDWDPRHPAFGPEACFKFHVDLPPDQWFVQEPGDVTNIYWLSIEAVYPPNWDGQYPWGWKTRPRDLNSPAPDDAVAITSPIAPLPGSQFAQGYPLEYPAGTSWDMAFELTAGPEPPKTDWGDAPRPYPTLSASAGASHTIVPGLFIGARVDGEADGQPDLNALGDDNNPPLGVDDEDGVAFNYPFFVGQAASVTVQASANNLVLNAWYDFGADGSWAESGDQIFTNVALALGVNNLSFSVPTSATATNSFARFRVSTSSNLAFAGPAPDGEVEDYEVRMDELDFGDAPDPKYPTLRVSNGARHVVGPMFLGQVIDSELDGQPNVSATGDDLNPLGGPDDEDGVQFHAALISGVPNTVTVTTSIGGYLQVWLDANGDGDWADLGEQVVTDKLLVAGPNAVNFTVPKIPASLTKTYMRFRLSGVMGLGYVGLAPDGEVEDYEVKVEPLKWLQKPELGWEGVDVDNFWVQLADDFLCMETGPITDVHLWGSFVSDLLPPGGLGSMTITLFLYSDVPAGVNSPHSHPGQLLWQKTFGPGQYTAGHAFRQPEGEWWHDPSTQFWKPGADQNIYQFDFYIDREQAYSQVEGTIYWLGMKYTTSQDDGFTFGWKTTYEPWNDDACWLDTSVQPAVWREMHYADGHPWAELPDNSLNLAFAISGEPGEALDFGDAPDNAAAPGHPTLLANNGARHTIVPGLMLGNIIDAEADGQPNATATGDDINGPVNDEDGVSFVGNLLPGQPYNLQILASANGFLNAWMDFNGDASWTQAGDQILTNQPLTAGNNVLTFAVPATATWGVNAFARFRFNSTGNLSYAGAATDGEVEDYRFQVEPMPQHDLGDAPASFNNFAKIMMAYPKGGPAGVPANFPTTLVLPLPTLPTGPIHMQPQAVAFLGRSVSFESSADLGPDQDLVNNLDPLTDQSDRDGADDGLLFPLRLPHCRDTQFAHTITFNAPLPQGGPLLVNVWCDWDRGGGWGAARPSPGGATGPAGGGRNQPVAVPPGPYPVVWTNLTLPFRCWHPALSNQPIWMRITLAEQPWPAGGGGVAAGDGPINGYSFGETEDYYITTYQVSDELDFSDAPGPFPTTLASDGARHFIIPGFSLGNLLDSEADGLPNPLALGDDLNNLADEDGVTFVAPVLVNTQVCVNVFLTGGAPGGRLDGWLDLNKNGVWESAEQIFGGQPLVAGANAGLCFAITNTAKLGTNIARFRLSSLGGLSATGVAQDGEVEDYQVILRQRPPTTNIVITWIGVTNTTPTNQVVTVQWNAETNVHYEVLATPSLGTNSGTDIVWQIISPEIIGPSNQHTHTNTTTSQRYYRVLSPWTYP